MRGQKRGELATVSAQSIFKAPEVDSSSRQTFALTALRMAIGWHLLYEGIAKTLQGNWSSASYLSSSTWIFAKFFRLIAEVPWALKIVDIINVWALTVLGLCLVLGYLTRSTTLCSAGLLMLYYVTHPPFTAGSDPLSGPGSYLIVDHNLVEAAALVVLALVRPRSLYGLDRLRYNRAHSGERPADQKVSLDRRDFLTNLAGIPVLGALAAAVAATRTGGLEPRDTILAGASPSAGPPARSVRSGNIVSIRDYERLAPTKMSATSYEFIAGGAGDDQTVYWNQAAFQRIVLRPKAGIDVLKIDTQIHLFGRVLPHPIMLSPASEHGRLHPEGEKATARGAGAADAILMVSTFATEKMEDIAKAASWPLWHATYLFKDRGRTSDLIQRAQASGYQAIVLPIDDPVAGARDREERAYRFTDKPVSFQSYPVDYYRYAVSWADVEWYAAQAKLPLVVKGILNPDDAEQAIKVGAKAIFVSNHGGRSMDTVPATIDVLPAIVDRVAGRVPVLIDSGIRRGTDVLKALAYGATAVSIGRPYLYGLAVKGPEGVTGVINILRNELEMAMACAGRPTIASIDRSVIAGHLDFPNFTAPGQFWPD
jgi:4-hydroxymandelate oxidase